MYLVNQQTDASSHNRSPSQVGVYLINDNALHSWFPGGWMSQSRGNFSCSLLKYLVSCIHILMWKRQRPYLSLPSNAEKQQKQSSTAIRPCATKVLTRCLDLRHRYRQRRFVLGFCWPESYIYIYKLYTQYIYIQTNCSNGYNLDSK